MLICKAENTISGDVSTLFIRLCCKDWCRKKQKTNVIEVKNFSDVSNQTKKINIICINTGQINQKALISVTKTSHKADKTKKNLEQFSISLTRWIINSYFLTMISNCTIHRNQNMQVISFFSFIFLLCVTFLWHLSRLSHLSGRQWVYSLNFKNYSFILRNLYAYTGWPEKPLQFF